MRSNKEVDNIKKLHLIVQTFCLITQIEASVGMLWVFYLFCFVLVCFIRFNYLSNIQQRRAPS